MSKKNKKMRNKNLKFQKKTKAGIFYSKLKEIFQWFIIILPAFLLFSLGFTHRWNTEDAFISFRVIQNLNAGYGPVFNIDERVEVYTHPLWIAILSLSSLITKSIEWTAVCLGLIFSFLGVLFGTLGEMSIFRRLKDNEASLLIPLGMFVIVSLPPFWDFATSGLETGLSFFYLGFSFYLMSKLSSNTKILYKSLFWFSLGTLIRPDMGLFWIFFLFFSILILLKQQARFSIIKIIKIVIFSFSLPFSYQIFRMGYFASFFPNPALAKEAFKINLHQGIVYLWDFISPYGLYIPLGIFIFLLLICRKKEGLVLFPFILSGLLHILYIVLMGGDFMHARYLLPGFFSLLLTMLPIFFNTPFRAFLISIVIIWCFTSALWLRVSYKGGVGKNGITDERGFFINFTLDKNKNPVKMSDYEYSMFHWVGINTKRLVEKSEDGGFLYYVDSNGMMNTKKLAKESKNKVFLYHPNIGISGFVAGSKVHVFDVLGIADPIGGRLVLKKRGTPGHEKNLPLEWAMARIKIETENPKVQYAKEAMECGELKDYLEAITEKLTINRFLNNLAIAWKSKNLRIPSDPYEAKL
ncbi:TPA: hypothetical protein DCX16_02710, partial [bacterium]|nr:hypothetical protein [bacterium]